MGKEMKTILVVDDDMIWRETITDALEHSESERFSFPWVLAVSSAEEALEIIKEEKISLIISDIWMSGMSGLEFFSKVQRESRIPFILMSGVPGMEKEVKKIGVEFFIPKPFWSRDLIKLVRKAWKQ
ncbi:MAG TPA: response regulator [Candidatus Moranbacteria bacterium]|nr:response regulator [Candidatus Moranbacteria bacterium]